MAEVLTCNQCGGLLDENYKCPFCGAVYVKPQDNTTTYNVNIVNNYGTEPPPAPIQPPAQPTEEPPREKPTGGTDATNNTPEETDFVKDNSFQLIVLLLVAILGVCIGIWRNHDWMIVAGLISGALFSALSKPLGGNKK